MMGLAGGDWRMMGHKIDIIYQRVYHQVTMDRGFQVVSSFLLTVLQSSAVSTVTSLSSDLLMDRIIC